MELSERATRITPSLTLAIDSKAKSMLAAGQDVCGFGAGEPDFDTPEHIKAAAISALQSGFTKYTPSSGLPELRQAIADKFKADNGLNYKPGQIIVSNGAKHSCYNTILATCQPGDEVLIPSPYWLSYPEMVRLAGAEPIFVPTTEENGWKMTAADFENAMTPRTKMVIINSPGNPTGAVYTREELEAIAEVAAEEEILILSDEIYEKLIYDDAEHISIGSLSPEAHELTITINGFSKAYAMTGWRSGLSRCARSHRKGHRLDPEPQHVEPVFVRADGARWRRSPEISNRCPTCADEFNVRRDYMYDRLTKIPNVSVAKPSGAFYMLVNIGKLGLNSTNFSDRLLSKASVAVVPGIAFGDDRTIRLSYATSLDVIKRGLDRFEDFCRSV